ncbi:MAG: hypothetical protein AB1483_02485 [Candidatus Zixiibacteriota bacterium]
MANSRGRTVARSRRVGAWLGVLVACWFFVFLSGCSDSGRLNETANISNADFFEQAFDENALSKRTDVADLEIDFRSQWLQASLGGMIPLQEDAESEAFVVLPGSFLADTTFTVEITHLVTSTGEPIVLYDFGPDGLQFSRAAIVRINVAALFGKNVTTMNFYWLNPGTGYWELQDTYKADSQGYVYADISHFSSYAGGGADSAK